MLGLKSKLEQCCIKGTFWETNLYVVLLLTELLNCSMLIDWVFCFKLRNLLEQGLVLRGVAPILLKLFRGTRNHVLHTFPRSSLFRVGNGREEISSSLSRGAMPKPCQ